MDYSTLKHAHMGLAYLSIVLFIARFVLFSVRPGFRNHKVLKILPHIVDTFLLAFALILLWEIWDSPIAGMWIVAKVIGLLVYIGLGVVAMKRGSLAAFAGSLVCFAYILGAAKIKSVLSWLAYF